MASVSSHNGRWHSQGDAPDGIVGRGPRCHLDAVYDGADAEAEGAARAVRGDAGEVRDGVKLNRLVATVVAGHVALAAVDAHILVDHRHHLLLVVEVTVGPDHGDGLCNHILEQWKDRWTVSLTDAPPPTPTPPHSSYLESWDGLARPEGWSVHLGEERLHWSNRALVLSKDLLPLGQVGAEGREALPHHLLHCGCDHLPPLVGESGWGLAVPVSELVYSL